MLLLTHSRLAAYKLCPRKHWYLYKMGRRAIRVAKPLWVGTLVHKLLEIYWSGRMRNLPLEQCRDAAFSAIPHDLDPFESAKIRAMLTCYIALWNLYKGQVLAVEKKFEFVLVNPSTGMPANRWRMGGKIDLILKNENGIIELGEHKTTSNEAKPGGGYRQRTQIDAQISGYLLGAQSLGYDAVRVIYDVLRKPLQKPLLATPLEKRIRSKKTGKLKTVQREQDETSEAYGDRILGVMQKNPEAHIVRLECERSPEAQYRYYLNVWQWTEKMERDERAGIAPMNEDSCWRFDTPCEFWEVCSGITTIDNPMRYRDATSQHEELQDEEQPDQPVGV